MRKTLAEIATIVGGEVLGNKDLVITGLCGVSAGKVGELTYLESEKYLSEAIATEASAIITARDVTVPGRTVIRTDNPSLAFAKIAEIMAKEDVLYFSGVHATASIAADAVLENNVAVGPHVFIGSKARIGENCVIYPGCYIGEKTIIGKDSLIYANVTIRERIRIGERAIIHPGAVIGADGFGFNTIKGVHQKIPQLGTVEIGDDVEIGANTTIDRARFGKTVIRSGCKFDDIVHVAHNVTIEEHCIILAETGISGSVKIEKYAVLAGQVGVTGHLTIGKGAVVATQSAVTKSVPPGETVMGSPHKPQEKAKEINAHLQRLPKYIAALRELKAGVEVLEARVN